MDSPLNRAHQQERRAEKLISGKKYMEASACYEIACAYITEAMKTTTTSQALISMQLQFEDHLRKQKLLKFKMEKLAYSARMKLESSEQTKLTLNDTVETKNREISVESSSEILHEETSDCSFDLSLQSSQGVLVQAEDAVNSSQGQDEPVCKTSIEDLQMQVLLLTQALEDSNRENNHLRNIVIQFKDVLHKKFGFVDEEIEAMLASDEREQQHTASSSLQVEETHTRCICNVDKQNIDQNELENVQSINDNIQ